VLPGDKNISDYYQGWHYWHMKTIRIRKNMDFSATSRIYVKIGPRKVHIKGFEAVVLPVLPGEEISASHIWTASNRISYDQLEDGSSIKIRPRMGLAFQWIFMLVFLVCFITFNITRIIWLVLPVLFFSLYAFTYLTVLYDRYLILEMEEQGEKRRGGRRGEG
jgi:hypothetical protein